MEALDPVRGSDLAPRFDACALLYSVAAEHPGCALRLRVGAERLLIVQDAESATQILRTNCQNYHKNFATFTAIFGASRLTTDGARWRKLQKLSQPSLATCEPQEIATAVERHFGRAAKDIVAKASDQPVTVDRFLDRAAAGVVLEQLFGFHTPPFPDSAFDDLRVILRFCGQASWNLGRAGLPSDAAARAAAIEALTRWRGHVANLLTSSAARRGTPLLAQIAIGGPGGLDRFAEFSTLLFAGSDTSAAALGWSLWLLGGMPTLQDQLRSEIVAVLAGGPATPAKASALTNLLAFVNEALRIFPPVPFLSRVAVADVRLAGHRIAPGEKVLLSIIGLHHDQRFWPQPFNVLLHRFPDGAPSRAQRPHFLPFSDGMRRCGGLVFAMQELPIALMTILSRIRVLRPSDDAVAFEWGASLRRVAGQPLLIEPL